MRRLRNDAVDVVYGTVDGFARSACPTCRISLPSGGGEMASWKKSMPSSSAPARRARCIAAVLARAGKKVVLLEQGPDWQLTDLICSDIWGRRLKGAGPAILYEGKHPVGRTGDHGWGTGGAALHYSANFPRLLPDDFTMKSDHGRGARLADLLCRCRALLRQGRPGDRRVGRRQGRGALAPAGRALSDAAAANPSATARCGCRASRRWASTMVAGAGRHQLRSTTRAATACIYDGWCNAGCPTGRSPIRSRPVSARRAARARTCGRSAT